MECSITICIVSLNKKTGKYEMLSTEKESVVCPSEKAKPNISIKNQIQDIAQKYVDIDAGILDYIFLDINVTEKIDILYFCCVPAEITKTNTYFLQPSDYYAIILQKIIRIF